MEIIEKIDVMEKMVRSCFSKGRCMDCPFYVMPYNGHPGKCMGQKKIGPIFEGYLQDIREALKDGKSG